MVVMSAMWAMAHSEIAAPANVSSQAFAMVVHRRAAASASGQST